jgi:signal recognition particle subunit SEC65
MNYLQFTVEVRKRQSTCAWECILDQSILNSEFRNVPEELAVCVALDKLAHAQLRKGITRPNYTL